MIKSFLLKATHTSHCLFTQLSQDVQFIVSSSCHTIVYLGELYQIHYTYLRRNLKKVLKVRVLAYLIIY